MYFLRTVDGTINFVTESGWEPIKSIQHYDLLQRLVKSFPGGDTFNAAERDIIYSYITLAQDVNDVKHNQLRADIANVKVTVDSVAIAEAVSLQIAKYLSENGVDVDSAAIAAEVESVLADDFAAIPGAVVHEYATELSD